MSSSQGPNWRIPIWFPQIELKKLNKLNIVYDSYIAHQRSLSLFSRKSFLSFDQLHFADCILASNHIRDSSFDVTDYHDFFSGNGLLAFVFACLYDDVQVHSFEMDSLKIKFMNGLIKTAQLNNLTIISQKPESYTNDSIQVAFIRGSAPISNTLLALKDKIIVGGSAFHIKSEDWKNEIVQMPSQLFSIFETNLLHEYKLPESQAVSSVVISRRLK